MIDIKVPPVGESISEVTLIKWTKPDGQWVERDEILCELESEKATFELNAEQAGILSHVAKEGEDLKIGDLACTIDDKAERPADQAATIVSPVNVIKETAPKPEAQASLFKTETIAESTPPHQPKATPLATQIIADKHIDMSGVKGSGPMGRLTKSDVLNVIEIGRAHV